MGRKNRNRKHKERKKQKHHGHNQNAKQKKKSYYYANVELSEEFIAETLGTTNRQWSMSKDAVSNHT